MNNLLLAILIASSQQHNAVEDIHCAKAITYLEARGEGVKGIKAVRQVIANRARKSEQGMCKVVRKKAQFSSYKPGMSLKSVRTDKKFLQAWEDSSTMPPVLTKEYTHFFRRDVKPEWSRKMKCDRVVGHHVFCKERKLS